MFKATDKITINDVAKASGVSKGTVDRVLHNRGEVSRKTREKVLKVVDELGFKPNIYASMLASQKDRVIQCVIPEYQGGDFWSITAKGIDEASEMVSHYGIKVSKLLYDQYDSEAFQTVCDGILADPPAGVLIAPIFRAKTIKFVKELAVRQIPYIILDSKLEDDNYLAYFGMPMYQSGYLCADLLTNGTVPEKIYIVRIRRDKKGLSDPTVSRRTGFLDYIGEHCPETEIVNLVIDPNSTESIDRVMDEALLNDPSCKHIVMFNSRVHLVADYLRRRGLKDCRVVGFDFLEKNLQALRSDHVQLLIAQHTDMHTVSAVRAMSDYLIFGKTPSRRDNYTQMDILNKLNCDYYL